MPFWTPKNRCWAVALLLIFSGSAISCQSAPPPSVPSSLLDAMTDKEIGLLDSGPGKTRAQREPSLTELEELRSTHKERALQRSVTEGI